MRAALVMTALIGLAGCGSSAATQLKAGDEAIIATEIPDQKTLALREMDGIKHTNFELKIGERVRVEKRPTTDHPGYKYDWVVTVLEGEHKGRIGIVSEGRLRPAPR
jgi:hypothetical protein